MNSDNGNVETQFFSFGSKEQPFVLRSGESLPEVTLAYEAYGELNAAGSNAILLFHAMTGSQHAAGRNSALPEVGTRWTSECQEGWWSAFIGPGKALDTERFFVVCVNYLGGCYGSTGPASTNPATGKPYGSKFPPITFTDIVESQVRLLDHLGIRRLRAAVGASIGGMLGLTLATLYPDRVKTIIPIGSGMLVTPLQRILNLEQVYAIETDPNFNEGDYYDNAKLPNHGLALARMIAHKTFISLNTLVARARHEIIQPGDRISSYQVTSSLESYMLHQGTKFVKRFDANSYLRIIEAWQHFSLASESGNDSLVGLFSRCKGQQYLIFSIDSDVSFYPDEQLHMAQILRQAGVETMHITVHSEKGHDSFLLEPDLYTPHLVYTLERTE